MHTTSSLFINLSTNVNNQDYYKKYNIENEASHSILELPCSNFFDNDLIDCYLTKSFSKTHKITVQIFSLDEKYKFDDINPNHIFSSIKLMANITKNDTKHDDGNDVLIEELTLYFLDVYRDCFFKDKESYNLMIKPFISTLYNKDGDKIPGNFNMINLPLPFYFDRQSTKLCVTDAFYFIRLKICQNFINDNKDILKNFSLKILLETTLEKYHEKYNFRNCGIYRYCEYVEPIGASLLTPNKIQFFNFGGKGLCKCAFFGIIDSKTNEYVTQNIVETVSLYWESTTAMKLSIYNATILQQYHSGITPNKNHILLNFGRDCNFSNTFGGLCINMDKLANSKLCLTFNRELELDRYILVGFNIKIRDYILIEKDNVLTIKEYYGN